MKENKMAAEMDALKQTISALTKKLDPEPTNVRLGEWLQEWRNLYKMPFMKKGSMYPIDACISKHIPQQLQLTLLDELTAEGIQATLNEISTSRMRKYAYDTLKESLKKAHALKKTKTLVMNEVLSVKHKRTKGAALTIEEQRDFLAACRNKNLGDLFYFYILTGCRRSEALALKWSDIDFERNRIHIAGTKTDLSDRYVPLFPQTKTLLQSLAPAPNGGQIFKFSADFVTHAFKKLCPQHKLHDLRHTFATRCLESGISIKVVQTWLGHSQIETTANIYLHVTQNLNEAEADKFCLEPLKTPAAIEGSPPLTWLTPREFHTLMCDLRDLVNNGLVLFKP
ncbi:MAG: site-specific integrase [Firmicutes bacterium]|nr:site-specific integrase [Bacillota bacterium]